jgi:hypothetical protein
VMGGCQSCGGSGGDDSGDSHGPAELLNLGTEAEAYFATGGRAWYEEVRVSPVATAASIPKTQGVDIGSRFLLSSDPCCLVSTFCFERNLQRAGSSSSLPRRPPVLWCSSKPTQSPSSSSFLRRLRLANVYVRHLYALHPSLIHTYAYHISGKPIVLTRRSRGTRPAP